VHSADDYTATFGVVPEPDESTARGLIAVRRSRRTRPTSPRCPGRTSGGLALIEVPVTSYDVRIWSIPGLRGEDPYQSYCWPGESVGDDTSRPSPPGRSGLVPRRPDDRLPPARRWTDWWSSVAPGRRSLAVTSMCSTSCSWPAPGVKVAPTSAVASLSGSRSHKQVDALRFDPAPSAEAV